MTRNRSEGRQGPPNTPTQREFGDNARTNYSAWIQELEKLMSLSSEEIVDKTDPQKSINCFEAFIEACLPHERSLEKNDSYKENNLYILNEDANARFLRVYFNDNAHNQPPPRELTTMNDLDASDLTFDQAPAESEDFRPQEVSNEPDSAPFSDLSPIEITGTVKWFDTSKGFGFIDPGDPKIGDVFLHQACVSIFGYKDVKFTAQIHCLIAPFSKGAQVLRIIGIREVAKKIEKRTAQIQSFAHSRRAGWCWAGVRWFDRNRGCGFVRLEGCEADIFIHMDVLHRAGIRDLAPDQRLLVRPVVSSKGPAVSDLRADPQCLEA